MILVNIINQRDRSESLFATIVLSHPEDRMIKEPEQAAYIATITYYTVEDIRVMVINLL